MTTTNRLIHAISAISLRAEDDIKLEHTLSDDLAMDSIDHEMLTMLIEEEFEIEISDASWSACKTVADVLALVGR